jgi:hypothetical protein
MFHAIYLSSSSLGFLKEVFQVFSIYITGKTMTPWAEPIFTPGLLYEQTW